MKKPQEEYVSVCRLAETDDWDGVAAVGMHHCTYLHAAQALRMEPDCIMIDGCHSCHLEILWPGVLMSTTSQLRLPIKVRGHISATHSRLDCSVTG